MKPLVKIFLLVFVIGFSVSASAQDVSQLKSVDVASLSDAQVSSYWTSIQSKGYSMQQLEVLGKAQGVSALKIAAFKRRVQQLGSGQAKQAGAENTSVNQINQDAFGLDEASSKETKVKKNALFGFDFFNNPNITFTPNINLAVPDNYRLGPGDELLMDLWGATEMSYTGVINNQGVLKIEGIGQVYVNGVTFEQAKRKIRARLQKKHAGIGAAKNSYNKIELSINLTKVRTVQVNIIGEVKIPGTYSLVSLSTVLNALYAAGGPTKQGTFRAVQLIRNGKKTATFDVYKYLLSGAEAGNLQVQDQDVIIVSPYANRTTVKGAVKRPGTYELLAGETLSDLQQFFGGFTSNAYTDLLVVERVNGKQREVKEVKLADAATFEVKAGDDFVVNEVVNKFTNKVRVTGAVYRPGDFELSENMTLKVLLQKAEGVTDEAFLTRGILVRSYDDTNKENISFSVADVLSGAKTIVLQARDEVRIFRKDDLREQQTIRIQGAVNKPQQFEFVKNMQIEDVIAMAGGLSEGADVTNVSVSRRLKDGRFGTLSENYTIATSSTLEIEQKEAFYLQPFDIVNVRFIKGYTAQKTVTIVGEVQFQGSYVITNKNERVSDLVKRAGGVTSYAYLKGATLYRKKTTKSDKILLGFLEEINKKDSIFSADEIGKKNTNRIGIQLDKILSGGSVAADYDLFLEEGDELIIPSQKLTIEVEGEVLFPSLVKFQKGKSLKDYIENSGGFSQRAKKGKTFVLYANGEIKTVKNFLFFRTYPKVVPGAVIFVPQKKVLKNRMSLAEILGITTGLGTIGVLIQTLTR